MNTFKKIFGSSLLVVALVFAVPAKAQTYFGGLITTGSVTVVFATTNNIIDVTKPPNQFTGSNPKDNSWFEVIKDRGIAIQVEAGGAVTNNLLIFEASVNPISRTNWTGSRYFTVNIPTGGGVLVTNIASATLGNVRGVRLQSIANANAAGSFVLTNVLVGTWK